MCISHLIDDCIIKILMAFDSVKGLLFELEKPHTIDPESSHIKYEKNTPPQVEVENAKISVYAENPHHFNIFFWECIKTFILSVSQAT